MALNLACRRLRFHRDFLQPFSRGAHHLSRSFSNTAQASKPEWWFKKNAKFLALQRGLASEIGQGTTGPRGIKFLTEGERLAVLETEHSFLKGSIMDGIKSNKNQIEGLYWLGWIVAVFGFGVLYKTTGWDIEREDEREKSIIKYIEHTAALSEIKIVTELTKLVYGIPWDTSSEEKRGSHLLWHLTEGSKSE